MPDTAISGLPALTGALVGADLVATTVDVAGTPITRKAALAEIAAYIRDGAEGFQTSFTLIDDFIGGNITSGSIGALGWTLGQTGTTHTTTAMNGVADHPGILQRGTGATSGNAGTIHVRHPPIGPILLPATFDLTWIVRPNNVAAQTRIACGLLDAISTTIPNSGIYIEKDLAGTNWIGVIKNVATVNRTATLGTAVANAWARLRIRRVLVAAVDTVLFSVNGGEEVGLASSLINAAQAAGPFAGVSTNEAVTKLLDIDLFYMRGEINR